MAPFDQIYPAYPAPASMSALLPWQNPAGPVIVGGVNGNTVKLTLVDPVHPLASDTVTV